MIFTDSHCHLDFPELQKDLDSLIKQCASHNIKRIVIPSVSPNNWTKVIDLTATFSSTACQLFPCLGIHPWFLKSLNEHDLAQLTKQVIAVQNKIIAIGETGIDGKIALLENNLSKQRAFFEHHLMLANEVNKPVIVHHYQSHQHIVPLLKQHKPIKSGIIHAFSGSYQQAKAYLDLGFKLGIGGTITYPRAEKTRQTVKKLPLDCLVLETDAPAMPIFGYQGEHNSPLRISDIFKVLCDIRGEISDGIRQETPEQIAEQLEKNNQAVFNF